MFFAYLDPGAGSLLVQAIIAGALAVPFVLRAQVRTVIDRLVRRTSARSDSPPTDEPSR